MIATKQQLLLSLLQDTLEENNTTTVIENETKTIEDELAKYNFDESEYFFFYKFHKKYR